MTTLPPPPSRKRVARPSWPAARFAFVLILLCGSAALAEGWGGAVPGTTSMAEVLRTFGKPSKQASEGRVLVLRYSGKKVPRGARDVVFRFSRDDRLLRRIEVIPDPMPTPASLEATLGPGCTRDTPPRTPCYEIRATPQLQLAFHYRTLGVEVLFENRRIQSLAFVEPQVPAESELPAEPKPPAEPQVVANRTAAPSEMSPDSLLRPAVVDTSASSEPQAPSSSSEPQALASKPQAPASSSEPQPPASSPDVLAPRRVPIIEEEDTERWDAAQPRDIITWGGLYYQRAELSGSRSPEGTSLDPVLPSLVDILLQVKPSESTLSSVRGRLLYDPLDPQHSAPSAVLDQLWFKFDIVQRVFITAGRQPIKWGSSRLWNPTDFLRQPNPRPFDSFDPRTGIDMLKVNIPWESMRSNLLLVTTVDRNGPDSHPVRYGGAARAEVATDAGELALTAAFQQWRRPRYGLDWSMGAGPFDLYAELALVRDSDMRRWARSQEGFLLQGPDGPKLLASGGAAATFRVADIFQLVARLEGFYNPLGYDDRAMLTWLRSTGDYQALYFGRYYGMAQVTLSRRSTYQPDFTVTMLMNAQDRSGLGRFDVSVYALRDTIIQTFVELPFGERGSEFRFEPDPLIAELPASGLPVFNAGVSVRINM